MRIVDVGTGAPVVIIPGIQGRWEWMKPAVDALSSRCRVVTFSFADEPSCGGRFDPSCGFDSYVEQVKDAMDLAGLTTAVIAGVSYGGLVAAAFAARYPGRTAGLVLVSAIPPRWVPNARIRFYMRAPLLLSPLFLIGSLRMYKEIAVARSGVLPGMATAVRHGLNALAHMLSPTRMARRVKLLESVQLDRGLADVRVPTLVVTGDAALDNIVPVHLTEEYVRMWPHAQRATIARTGHIGLITRPEAFTAAVGSFVEAHGPTAAPARAKERREGVPADREKKVG
jgi:pimeloyl-ACP methyl ester carboxylesterase